MNPETIDELINVANCGIRTFFPAEIRYRDVKPHWWSCKTVKEPYEYTPDPEYFDLEDSLKAIASLGETDSLKALEALEKIYTPKIEYQSERYFVSGGSEPRDDDWKYLITISVVYPNAEGCLYEALEYIVSTRDVYEDESDDDLDDDGDYFDKLEWGELPPPENIKAHIVLQTAISKLKKTLAI